MHSWVDSTLRSFKFSLKWNLGKYFSISSALSLNSAWPNLLTLGFQVCAICAIVLSYCLQLSAMYFHVSNICDIVFPSLRSICLYLNWCTRPSDKFYGSKILRCENLVFFIFLQMPVGEILEAIKVFQPNLSMVATLIRHPNPDQYIKIFSTIFKYLRETHLIHIKVFQPNLSMVATLIRHLNPDQYIKIYSTLFKYLREKKHLIQINVKYIKVFQPNLLMFAIQTSPSLFLSIHLIRIFKKKTFVENEM